jgi:hypothetical protein
MVSDAIDLETLVAADAEESVIVIVKRTLAYRRDDGAIVQLKLLVEDIDVAILLAYEYLENVARIEYLIESVTLYACNHRHLAGRVFAPVIFLYTLVDHQRYGELIVEVEVLNQLADPLMALHIGLIEVEGVNIVEIYVSTLILCEVIEVEVVIVILIVGGDEFPYQNIDGIALFVC